MSLVELAAPSTRANRAAGVVLAVRPTLSPMVHSARCLLEYITHPSIQCSNIGLLRFAKDLLRLRLHVSHSTYHDMTSLYIFTS